MSTLQYTVIDFTVADTLYFILREVSRTHAKVIRRRANSDVEFILKDVQSTCGTYVNGNHVDPNEDGILLSHGDVISLGPSLISTYMFYCKAS